MGLSKFNGFVLGTLEPLELIEAVKLYCKPARYRTAQEQARLEYLVNLHEQRLNI